jgi:beta-aspartyl-peptidase (threonine type)
MRSVRLAVCFAITFGAAAVAADPPGKVVLVIHGGAGTPAQDRFTPEDERAARAELEQSLRAGHSVLAKGGSALDAVEAAIKLLEDSPRFNAGKGAVFTRDGTNELDASIMEGGARRAGAVAGVSRIKNPISAARAVMEKSEHVLLVGAGAERFAFANGLTEVSPRYFWTERRWKELEEKARRAESEAGSNAGPSGTYGTVGAVALDKAGHLAAGTSTGGMTYKRSGRLGDSPIIGAGTYADDRGCGVSGTGHGETFIRHAIAFDVNARMLYKRLGVKQAAEEVFAELPKEEGGVGGIIALDRAGNVAMTYNTRGMYRGTITENGSTDVRIFDK